MISCRGASPTRIERCHRGKHGRPRDSLQALRASARREARRIADDPERDEPSVSTASASSRLETSVTGASRGSAERWTSWCRSSSVWGRWSSSREATRARSSTSTTRSCSRRWASTAASRPATTSARQLSQAAILKQILALQTGSAFICASERQRDLWLGVLGALGRIDLDRFRSDPSLDRLVGVVPFGLEADEPKLSEPGAEGGRARDR